MNRLFYAICYGLALSRYFSKIKHSQASGADNNYDTCQSAGLGITEMLANDKKVDTAD